MKDRKPEEALISLDFNYKQKQFIPLCKYNELQDDPTGEVGYGDVAVFESPIDQYDKTKKSQLEYFCLDNQIGRPMEFEKGYLNFMGYPYSTSKC